MRRRRLNGYIMVYEPGHPKAMTSDNWKGFVYEHILVAERDLKRPIKDNEDVHHLDFNRANNTPSNLIVLEKSQHTKLHMHYRKLDPNIDNVKNIDTSIRCQKKGCDNVVLPNRKYCSDTCYLKDNKGVKQGVKRGNNNIWHQPKADYSNLMEVYEKNNYNMTQTGLAYGVSGNTIKKHLIKLGKYKKTKFRKNENIVIND